MTTLALERLARETVPSDPTERGIRILAEMLREAAEAMGRLPAIDEGSEAGNAA